MPELPEVETIRRGLARALVGHRLIRVRVLRPDLRLPVPEDFVQRLTGKRIETIDRRAKYLLFRLETGLVIIAHLGMSGRFLIDREAGPPGPHDHIEFETDEGQTIRFRDPRRFGLMVLSEDDALENHALLARLGPEPDEQDLTGEVLARRLDGKKTSIKAALLDQRIISGLGNIYVCEALYHAGISPKRSAGTVRGRRATRLIASIRRVLAEAIESGGSSLRDYATLSGELGYFQHRFAAYDHEGKPCPSCDCDIEKTGGIRRIVQGGRSTFYCPRRQR